MSAALEQHQAEMLDNRRAWERKTLLREIYRGFYERILAKIDRTLPGRVAEIGSGIGNLREYFPEAIATDLFPNPWLDIVCDGYELPFRDGSVSHLILFDVFHHLEAPNAFFREAERVIAPAGKIIVFDPYISLTGWGAYGAFHHEPVAWNDPIDLRRELPRPRSYYAAQGNATRLFFSNSPWRPSGWRVESAERFAAFDYLLSGGFSKPALYPTAARSWLRRVDEYLNRWPRLFAARCLISFCREPIRGH